MHQKFMGVAIDEAKKAKEMGDWPFGAVVVKNNIVVGADGVREKVGGDISDHAEIRAIRNACKNLKSNNLSGCSIYCTNEPCLMCASAIFQAGISHVYIAISRDDLPHLLRPRKLKIENLIEDLGYNPTIVRGLLKEKAILLFDGVNK